MRRKTLTDMLECQVYFLDDTHYMWELERNAVGRDLFNKVCEHLDLLERDYYGLAMWESPNTRVWLDCAKEVRKQIKGPVAEFFLNIKFYPPDLSVVAEDITSYLLCLQLRKDIMSGRLPCPSDILAVLGSYTVQSTLGDYDPNLHKNNYVSDLVLAPNQSEALEQRVMELHSTHRSMSPEQADMLFLEYAKTLPMYGVDLHPAKDVGGADVMLGVCSEGLMVYEDEIKIKSFSWPRVLKISHKRNILLLKIRPSEQKDSDGDVSFTLPSYRACKQLWKCAVENHSFFRNRLQDTKAKRFLTPGSRFRYHGRTQCECVEASANITRAPPQFTRFAIKRKANEDILKVLKQPVRTELDDWFLVHDSDRWDIFASDDVMLESKQLWESKLQADDWFILLDCSLFAPSGLQQPLQTEEQEEVEIVEENVSEERTADGFVIKRSYNVQVAQEGSVELEVMEELAREILVKEHPELKEQIMGQMKDSVTEEILEVNGERIQRVVITKQWTQETNSFVESQEDGERKMESLETVKRRVVVTEGGELLGMGSEEKSERLEIMETRLQEVESVEQELVDAEVLRVRIQEVKSLEQRLQQAEKEGLQQAETADWYHLLDRSPSMLTTAPTAQEELQQLDIPKPMERNDDWYILLEMFSQTTESSARTTDTISSIPGEDQAEEESREAERKIQQELLPPEKPKTQTREKASVELYEETSVKVIQSGVRIEEEQKELHKQVKVDDRRPQPVLLEQRTEQPQRDMEDDWFIILDVSPKTSVPLDYAHLRGATVELYEETREEVLLSRVRIEEREQQEQLTVEDRRPQSITLEQRAAQPQRDIEDDWFIILDVSPKGSVPLAYPHLRSTTVEMYEESREEPQSRVRTEEVEYKQQEQVTVEDRSQQALLDQRATQPRRDREDDWSIILDVSPTEGVPTTVTLYEESREEVLQSRVRQEQVMEVMTMSAGQTVITEEKMMSVIQNPVFPAVSREVDDDWFKLFKQVPYVQRSCLSVPPTVELYEESREEVLQRRVRRQEHVMEVMTVSTGDTVITEETMVKVVQAPQEFPAGLREVDDDWFQMFDPEPYEQRSFPSDVKIRDVEVREPPKDQRVQRTVERVVEEQVRGERVFTEERRVITEERRERVDVMRQMFPVGVREVEDDWFELLHPTPFEKRDVPTVATQEQVMKEQKDRRVREQERRMRDDVESRMKQQEIRRQEPEVKRAPPAVIVQTVVQPQREVEDDWFILFDVSPKQTVVGDVVKVDKEAEEVRQRVEERIREEERKREEERRKQIKVEERLLSVREKRPGWIQREVEDDWYTLMGVSPKDSVSTPVISPMALPKPRPHILVDQPLTSTPTVQSVSTTKKIHQDRTKDTLDITLESEAEESVLIRKSQRWTKRIEGESIYVRHSILMLEDSDVTQEVILKHHASISELKRVFMESMQEFGPTEWDQRLSSYSPTPKPQLPHANGEILISMGLIEQGKTVL